MPPRLPPRDERGEVLPHDHNEILNDDDVIRRISQKQVIWDDNLGRLRISSLAGC
jgi:hypothetical protein